VSIPARAPPGKRESLWTAAWGDLAMYDVSVYQIVADLWRWEIRRGGVLLQCGTAPTQSAAEIQARCLTNS
jgi:hypothetical protein